MSGNPIQRKFSFTNLRNLLVFLILIPLLFPLTGPAQTLIELQNDYHHQITYGGFILDEAQKIKIEGTTWSGWHHSRHAKIRNVWILDTRTRQVVWDFSEAREYRSRQRIVEFKDEIHLEAAEYEVYFAPNFYEYDNFWDDDIDGINNLFGYIFYAIFDGNNRGYRYRNAEDSEFSLKIFGKGTTLSKADIRDRLTKMKNDAFISFTELRRNEMHEQIFEVKEPAKIKIYALGEARDDGDYDFGWIINLENRKKVWQLTYRKSEHAGGARKNRLSNEIVELEPGTYKAVYITDDSHHYDDWNSAPPVDPFYWGLSIWHENEKAPENLVKNTLYEDGRYTIVEFERVRDNARPRYGFTLKQKATMHILALGEGRRHEMFDYGMIIDAKTNETVWMMDYDDTTPAGGARKNRMFDGLTELDAGSYYVYYISDGSHHYGDWNDDPPYQQQKWGISCYIHDRNFDPANITEFNPEDDDEILASVINVGDDSRIKKHFTLKNDGAVSIYAIGEGLRGKMYDYGWIENRNTGEMVWKMKYNRTRHAGGARKNRLCTERIFLEAGDYYLIYKTDDSHSFYRWNDDPPRNPVNWGVTLRLDD